MLKAIKQCVGWLDWKVVAAALAVLAILALCFKLPTIGMLAGATPLLVVAACLVPCLVPIALMRAGGRRNGAEESDHDSAGASAQRHD